jgi:hypothetical protein
MARAPSYPIRPYTAISIIKKIIAQIDTAYKD